MLVLDLLLVGPLISALHVNAVVEIGGHRRPQVGAVLMRGARVLPVVAAAQIVAAFGTGFGFVLLIVPGVLLLARWAVVAQTAALEDVNWITALRRSAELTTGSYLHVLGLLISVGVINVVVARVGSALSGSGASVGAVIAGIVFEMITLSFAALTSAMLYFDLRARKRCCGAQLMNLCPRVTSGAFRARPPTVPRPCVARAPRSAPNTARSASRPGDDRSLAAGQPEQPGRVGRRHRDRLGQLDRQLAHGDPDRRVHGQRAPGQRGPRRRRARSRPGAIPRSAPADTAPSGMPAAEMASVTSRSPAVPLA